MVGDIGKLKKWSTKHMHLKEEKLLYWTSSIRRGSGTQLKSVRKVEQEGRKKL